jgi:hypothetical protein
MERWTQGPNHNIVILRTTIKIILSIPFFVLLSIVLAKRCISTSQTYFSAATVQFFLAPMTRVLPSLELNLPLPNKRFIEIKRKLANCPVSSTNGIFP